LVWGSFFITFATRIVETTIAGFVKKLHCPCYIFVSVILHLFAGLMPWDWRGAFAYVWKKKFSGVTQSITIEN
jgi:hypothetical protein